MLDRRVPGFARRPSNRLTVASPRAPGRLSQARTLAANQLLVPGRFRALVLPAPPAAPGAIKRRSEMATTAEALDGTNVIKTVSPAGVAARTEALWHAVFGGP